MAGFRKAKAEQKALKVAIYGPPGSGKTFTTLLIAEGLAQREGKRIAYVDTEHGTDFYAEHVKQRTAHPDAFDFDALYTRSLMEISKSVRDLDPKTYCVVVIDSMTHVWEAAKNAFSGRTNAAGQIPFHQWGKIKKPYKDLVDFLMNSPLHVFLLGRQGNEFKEDEETGELKNVGTKMKAEGDTPYDPNVLIHMEAKRQTGKPAIISAFAEKDRSGVLAGRVIEWPNYEKVAKPILDILGGDSQAQLQSSDDAALVDSEAQADAKREKDQQSAQLLRSFRAQFDMATSADEVKAVGKEITPAVKRQMLKEDVAELKVAYLEADKRVAQGAGA